MRDHGQAVAGVRVDLTAPGLRLDTTTDASGMARFHHVPWGRARVATEGAHREFDVRSSALLVVALDRSENAGQVTEAPSARPVPAFFGAKDLAQGPRPSDPWSVLRDVPGVVVDRVNVGGSDSPFQAVVVSHGDATGGAFTLDGFDVGDPASLGALAFYPDMDSLDAMVVGTLGSDVRVRAPGAQSVLVLRGPAQGTHGSLHVRGSDDALEADNLPEALSDRPFYRNRTDRLIETGAEAQGSVAGGRLWVFGAASRNQLDQTTFTEHDESVRTTNLTFRSRFAVLGSSFSVLALRSEKVHEDRDITVSTAPEARWRQSGASWLLAGQGLHQIGPLSVVTRLSYLDSGFRLEPQGGLEGSAYEDLRGVLRRSYYSLETERPRLQTGLEARTGGRRLGVHHEASLGLGYRRSQVTTRQHWPGNGVLGLERQSVFFRTFHLTGFALPQRDLEARTVQDHLEGYVQDTLRAGRWALDVGLRVDRLSGHNLPSSVPANPVVPEDLPAVDFAGSPARFRWLDVLPRAALLWDVTGTGRTLLRAGYGAYGSSLGTFDVVFDNPVGRETASVSYYWLDKNANRTVENDELDQVRGRLGTNGIVPGHPGSTTSPHAIDPAYRAPRTHETFVSLERSFGSALSVGVTGSWRRLLHARWTPVRNLTLEDYAIRGAAQGELFDESYSVGYYAPASESKIVPGNGRLLTNREGYRQDALVVEASAGGIFGRRGSWRLWGSYSDWRESFTNPALSIQDPTATDVEPLQDQGAVAVRSAGLGRDVFVNSRWSGGASLRTALPLGGTGSLRVGAREGFPIPYIQVASTGDPTAGSKPVLVSPHLDAYRLPALVLVDIRLERGFALGSSEVVASVDVFNLLNAATTLQVARDVELPAFDRPREITRPRIARLGLEVRF